MAQAQLVGWLEGLFHGIQATLFAQQMAARNQLENMRRSAIGPGPTTAKPAPVNTCKVACGCDTVQSTPS